MWVERTESEVARWHEITKKDARSHGLLMACVVWLGVTVFATGGLYYTRFGIVARRHVAAGLWVRLVVYAIGFLPFVYWIYRHEMRKELEKATRRTLCPSCGKAGERRVGTACGCGGTVVSQSTRKWIEV